MLATIIITGILTTIKIFDWSDLIERNSNTYIKQKPSHCVAQCLFCVTFTQLFNLNSYNTRKHGGSKLYRIISFRPFIVIALKLTEGTASGATRLEA